jgi:hypothetical protein
MYNPFTSWLYMIRRKRIEVMRKPAHILAKTSSDFHNQSNQRGIK